MSGREIWPCTEGPGRRDVELAGTGESERRPGPAKRTEGLADEAV
jgi:hypothetical protein